MSDQPAKRSVGRPPIDGVPRTHHVHCKVTKQAKELLRDAAEARGVSMSQFLEMMILVCCKEAK